MKWTAKYWSWYKKKPSVAKLFFEKMLNVLPTLGIPAQLFTKKACRLEDYMGEPDCPWPRRPE